ncbi:HAMP domain-containing histidine kinase [Flavobacterium amniphilum]|uniref:PorY family sensor histidine kinase n=1 Tax=Flavobacterium amniphilum TaxID=1834035 RepID=UPI002029DE59|nr:HAMP domain-containing sensor histidine kinase [Flavobacterium amniphilum]MCL9805640.1 HAMP domain-containing histidine kinase [Flavobacterium amniphilum]
MTTSNQFTEPAINGKMTKKLLHKTLRYYLIFSLIVMLLAVPLFFFISQWLYFHEADEALAVQKEEFVKFYVPQIKENEIAVFNKLNSDLHIEENKVGMTRDTIYDRNFYNHMDKENEPFRILKSPVVINQKPYIFSVRANLVDDKELAFIILGVFTIIILILLIGLFIITGRLSVTLWKPFYRTLEQIEQFEIDKNSNPELVPNDIEEFNRLNTALNKLIERNSLIYKSQREFIENAAHELQTPIAIFKGKLETLLQHPDVTKEQFEILDNLNDTTNRLSRLNKNLLLLSKIESKLYNIPEDVILNDVIANQMDFFKEQAMAKNIQIDTKMEENCIVKANLFLSEIMVKNLFLNAINHNVRNGNITISLDKTSLIFSNTGELKSLETDKLFERFSKVNPSSKGNGLGLSIIKKIAENNSWEVHYKFRNNLHVFEIVF